MLTKPNPTTTFSQADLIWCDVYLIKEITKKFVLIKPKVIDVEYNTPIYEKACAYTGRCTVRKKRKYKNMYIYPWSLQFPILNS